MAVDYTKNVSLYIRAAAEMGHDSRYQLGPLHACCQRAIIHEIRVV